jgi:1-pyrroline-5-carboxylate dehydrogenase
MPLKMKITYSTMSTDNEELQSGFDESIARIKGSWLGKEHSMLIDGKEVFTREKFQKFSPIDKGMHLGTFQKGTKENADQAISAAAAAFETWRNIPWEKRADIIFNLGEKISENNFDLSTIMILEVGKSRLEALGEVEEAADLLRYYANAMRKNNGYLNELGKLSENEKNISALKPYGVWVVISPFNFPMALSAAPIAAALVTGNTVVFKGSSDTPYSAYMTARLFFDAGLPAGAFNFVTGPGSTIGQELLDNPRISGWTFTGSYDVGMKVAKAAMSGAGPRPAIIEMGGKNPTLVSNKADIKKAAMGVMRSAFGLDGQKCSACSRVYVQEGIYEAFKKELLALTKAIVVDDPTKRTTFMGTVINKKAYEDYQHFVAMAKKDGRVLFGGEILSGGHFDKGYYVTPCIVEGLPEDHSLVRTELFLPILHLAKCSNLEEGTKMCNDTIYGLTAGFFSEDEEEAKWWFNNIHAGTTYVNRSAGATTGAWPGVQVFGGWKASGASGKGIGGLYTLPLYMHEQSQTVIY